MIIHDIVWLGEWKGDLRLLSEERYIAGRINSHRLNMPQGVPLISPEHTISASRRNKVAPSSLSPNLLCIAVELYERILEVHAIPSFSFEDDLPLHIWRIGQVIVAGDKQIGESMVQVDLRINGIVKTLNLRLEMSI